MAQQFLKCTVACMITNRTTMHPPLRGVLSPARLRLFPLEHALADVAGLFQQSSERIEHVNLAEWNERGGKDTRQESE